MTRHSRDPVVTPFVEAADQQRRYAGVVVPDNVATFGLPAVPADDGALRRAIAAMHDRFGDGAWQRMSADARGARLVELATLVQRDLAVLAGAG